MADLKRRFARADEIGMPDLWEEARNRSTSPRPIPAETGATTARRIVAALTAIAVFTGAAVFAWRTFNSGSTSVKEPEPTIAPAPGPFEDVPAGWTEFPAPPEVRSGAATAWTGTELITWGGYLYSGFSDEVSDDDGFAFDAATRTWRILPPWPLSSRSFPASAWTGSELLVWGGWDLGQNFFDDGAAYDPATDTWRALPPAPIDGRMPFSVWTGRELVVWGSRWRDARRVDGAAYDPATNAWRPIAAAPIELTDATAVWTGEEMIVFGAALHGGNFAESETAIGEAYDPDADTWRRIVDSELSPQASTAAWNGREMIAWDYLNGSAAFDPGSDSWRRLPDVPLDESECTPQSAASIVGFVFGDNCGLMALFDPTEDAWRDVSRDPFVAWGFELVTADPVVLLLGHDIETGEARMLAYRPSADEASPAGDPAPTREPTPFVPEVTVEGDLARVDVTFPDGSAATLVYPARLELASGGIQPDVSYVWIDDPPPRYPIVFLHGPPGVEAGYVEGEPGTTFPLPGGGDATVWAASGSQFTRHRDIDWWLAYRTPSWTILVSLEQETDAAELAGSLAVAEKENEDGFPSVAASGPVALAEGFGESEGPVLTIGDGNPYPDLVSNLFDGTIFLSPDGCTGGPEFDPEHLDYYGSNCLGEGSVFASIYGDPDFIRAVLDGLRVESFTPAPS